MSNGYQREIVDFLRDYGATSVEVAHGGKHPRIEFNFRGKPCYYVIASTPSDHRAGANTISDLKRMLGEPVEAPEREARQLADMLPAAPDRPTYVGKMACYTYYKGVRLRFVMPRGVTEAFRLEAGRPIGISLLDKDVWNLHPGQAGDASLRGDGTQLIVDSVDAAQKAGFTDPFGISPADFSIVGASIVVHLHRDKLRTVNSVFSAAGKKGGEAARPTEPLPQTAAEPAPQAAVLLDVEEPVETRLRALLAMIGSAERQTGYRLVKVRSAPDAEPAWLWRAPDIRL